jgi:hypothetical protein
MAAKKRDEKVDKRDRESEFEKTHNLRPVTYLQNKYVFI